ncbi:MAG: 2-dehydro-3-deoxygalactonokinase, partial [Bacteroidota bacterium]
LKSQIAKLPHEHRHHLLIVSGMASSNIGLRELEYSGFPIEGNGSSLKWERIALSNEQDLLLISGVKTDQAMMRGEEVQAIGIAEWMPASDRSILILPGTHSKHITFNENKYTGLRNYMTGELFSVLATNSILSNSIIESPWTEDRKKAFEQGLEVGLDHKLNESLLAIRARDLFGNSTKEDNFYYLSGILIGDELSYLTEVNDAICLAASASLATLYQTALERLFEAQKLSFIHGHKLEAALLAGQKKIMILDES